MTTTAPVYPPWELFYEFFPYVDISEVLLGYGKLSK